MRHRRTLERQTTIPALLHRSDTLSIKIEGFCRYELRELAPNSDSIGRRHDKRHEIEAVPGRKSRLQGLGYLTESHPVNRHA